MTYATDIIYQKPGIHVVDNLFSFNYATDIPIASIFCRDNFDEVAYSSTKKYHPNYNKLVLDTRNLFVMKGSVKLISIFDDEPDMEMISQFEQYAVEENDMPYTLELKGKTFSYGYEVDYSLNTWQNPPQLYAVDVDTVYLEYQKDGGHLLCVLRLDDDPEAWTNEIVDVRKGNPFLIEKEGNKCYVVSSGSSDRINPFKMYELTSDSIEITANEDLRLYRIYRD